MRQGEGPGDCSIPRGLAAHGQWSGFAYREGVLGGPMWRSDATSPVPRAMSGLAASQVAVPGGRDSLEKVAPTLELFDRRWTYWSH